METEFGFSELHLWSNWLMGTETRIGFRHCYLTMGPSAASDTFHFAAKYDSALVKATLPVTDSQS